MNLQKINPKNILFLDIETVPQSSNWKGVKVEMQELWAKKTQHQRKDEISAEEYYEERAGIISEFGKIICISCGIIVNEEEFKVKSFYGEDEKKILMNFNEMLREEYFTNQLILCAHNGKEFDFPYMARRMVIHQIELPAVLQLQGKKPWEIPHLDTMELWKFGDYKHFTSISLLAEVLGISTPKDDIDGSQVAKVYYEDQDLERIKIYCEKDVFTVAQIFRKFRYESLLTWQEN